MKTIFYRQTETVDWLKTTKKCDIWTKKQGSIYIQPMDVTKRNTPFGVDLSLVEPFMCDLENGDSNCLEKNPDFVWEEISEENLYLYYVVDNINENIDNLVMGFFNEKTTLVEIEQKGIDSGLMSKRTYEKKIKIGLVLD